MRQRDRDMKSNKTLWFACFVEEIYDMFLLNKEVSDGSKTIRAKLLNKVHERESRAYTGGRSIIGVR